MMVVTMFGACSGGHGPGDGNRWGPSGHLALSVKNARRPNGVPAESLPDLLRAETFRVVVSGADFAPPIEAFFPGDSASGVIEEIPVGENRSILVEAINAEGKVIRHREAHGIRVKGGKTTQVEITLLSVPVITNLTDGAVVTTSRLRLFGYGEPAAPLELTVASDGVETILPDISTAETMISPSLSDGTFSVLPPVLSPGIHTLRIKDLGTGEIAEVTVMLVPPGRMPGTVLSMAGGISRTAGLVTTSGLALGPAQVQTAGSGLPDEGRTEQVADVGFFPDVIDQMLQPGGPHEFSTVQISRQGLKKNELEN